jgi:hypothetical protein
MDVRAQEVTLRVRAGLGEYIDLYYSYALKPYKLQAIAGPLADIGKIEHCVSQWAPPFVMDYRDEMHSPS